MNKNLYIYRWLVDMLDTDGERYGGPGVVVSTAINAFCNATDEQKRAMLKNFREAEINHAYPAGDADLLVDDAESDTAKKKQNRNHPSSEVG